MIENLKNIIESILFVSGHEIAITSLHEPLGYQKSEVKKAIAALKDKHSGESGIRLIEFNGKIQLATNPDYATSVAAVLNPIRERELTSAALETAAIIAYRQPITRLEIEQVRGVSSDYATQVLLKHGLIEEVGRKDVIGKPVLFGTTDAFLKRFQIASLNELPDYEHLLESIKELNEKHEAVATEDKGLYNEFEIKEQEEANK